LTHPRPSETQIGTTLQRLALLGRLDHGPYHALRRITDVMVELYCRRTDADYHNDLRPNHDDTVSGTREPDEQMFERVMHPIAEATTARNQHTTAADRLTKLAGELEMLCGWVDPPKGHRDHRGRLQVESVGQDGVRRVG